MDWLGLVIGNSRSHWAYFRNHALVNRWDTPHSLEMQTYPWQQFLPLEAPGKESPEIPLFFASVVPQQTQIWRKYPNSREIILDDVPLTGMYASLGIDRALAVYAALKKWDVPALVVDGGTALTFTGGIAKPAFEMVGGAILPGLDLQLRSLVGGTAALPFLGRSRIDVPSRWGRSTIEAIRSGVVYTILAGVRDFVQDWQQQFPESKIVLTGGDAPIIEKYLQGLDPTWSGQLVIDPDLIFSGIQAIVEQKLQNTSSPSSFNNLDTSLLPKNWLIS
ncbi:MAG: pantothenate kinase [Coleofasciculaceae cyanobacterium SM2_1_6]|nr:pantothenate kinase [Coleofasciculaceae cyanobacterium SM2_1_6]